MKVAVRLYEDVPANRKDTTIPGIWPYETRQVDDAGVPTDGRPFPEGETWHIWTQDEYEAYRAQHLETYMAWRTPRDAAMLAAEEAKLKARMKIAHGAMVIEKLNQFAEGMTEEEQFIFVDALEKVIGALRMGMLSVAATKLDAIVDVDMLDAPYAEGDERTVRVYYATLIRAGA